MLGKIEGRRRRGWLRMTWFDCITNAMGMILNRLGVGDGQGSLACYSSWGCRESDMTKWLNWTELCFVLFRHQVMTPRTAAHQASLSPTISHSLSNFMSISLLMPSNHLIFCCPLFFLFSIFPSIRLFSNELAHHIRWPKYWSFSFSISPSNEYSGFISFKIDWLDLFAVQQTPKSLL